jgi:hypothetical protein
MTDASPDPSAAPQPAQTSPPAPPTSPSPTTAPGWYSDPASGRQRWWDGARWTENFGAHTTVVVARNGAATASLILGIIGIVLMAIPFFIGWFVGGIPDLIAVILGIVGLNNAGARLGIGKGAAITGIVLGGVSILSVFLGAGSLW